MTSKVFCAGEKEGLDTYFFFLLGSPDVGYFFFMRLLNNSWQPNLCMTEEKIGGDKSKKKTTVKTKIKTFMDKSFISSTLTIISNTCFITQNLNLKQYRYTYIRE